MRKEHASFAYRAEQVRTPAMLRSDTALASDCRTYSCAFAKPYGLVYLATPPLGRWIEERYAAHEESLQPVPQANT